MYTYGTYRSSQILPSNTHDEMDNEGRTSTKEVDDEMTKKYNNLLQKGKEKRGRMKYRMLTVDVLKGVNEW